MDGFPETPERAVVEGRPQFGRYGRPFRDLNLLDAECGIPRLFGLRRLRLKEWVHIALVHQDWYLSMAIVDAKFLVTSWLHLFDRRNGRAFEHVRKLPPRRFRAPANVWDHSGRIDARGYRVYVHNNVEGQVHRLALEVGAERSLPAVTGDVLLHENPAHGWTVADFPVGGTFRRRLRRGVPDPDHDDYISHESHQSSRKTVKPRYMRAGAIRPELMNLFLSVPRTEFIGDYFDA